MSDFDFEIWDVFTDQRFAGNQLAVVKDAGALSTEMMQTITREFNLSETTFIMAPENQTNTARVRIFTIGYEMPFAGHPTVGTALAIARANNIVDEVRLELNAGIFPVVTKIDGQDFFAEFKNPNLPSETGSAPSPSAIEAALNLPVGSVDREHHCVRRVGAGVDYIYAKASLDAVRGASLNSAKFDELGLQEIVGVLLYAEGGERAGADYHTRMFAPNAGINEDPATGSAAAGFPGQIALSKNLAGGTHHWTIEQGFEMGRPSIIKVAVDIEASQVTSVRIGGNAVPVAKGVISI